ncbi:MAG: FxsA family protein [Rhodospirillales bacterium]|nr:FxsA family protein [Rhodospirillales bacterium]MCB9996996.1 FxsA family protein [Rhodospirillales bacterium]
MIFFIIFVIIPLTEIALFIAVGDEIGLLSTLFLCVLTAMIGAVLIRTQGLATLFSARGTMSRGELPVQEMFDGICLAVAGALLMTPGFFTDGIGFSLLVPQFRVWLRHYLSRRFDFEIHGSQTSYGRPRDPDVIEAEYERVDNKDKP